MSTIDQNKINDIKTKNRSALKVLITLYHPMFIGHYVYGGDLAEICNLSRSTIWRTLTYLWEEEMIDYHPEEKRNWARLTPTGARYARYFYEQLGKLQRYNEWTDDVSKSQVDSVLPSAKAQELKDELRSYLSFL